MLLDFGLSFNQCAWLCKLNDNNIEQIQKWMGENFEKMDSLDNEDWNKSDLEVGSFDLNDGDKK